MRRLLKGAFVIEIERQGNDRDFFARNGVCSGDRIAVTGAPRLDGWQRLNNSPTQEHAAALIEIAKIATYRFDRLVADANPIHSARTRRLDT